MQSLFMLIHPQIDPIALQLGPVAVHWYGLTYLAAQRIGFDLRTAFGARSLTLRTSVFIRTSLRRRFSPCR